jgi:GNAT superfamily N-acetyltransferase
MLTIIRTTSSHPDFISLVILLDKDLQQRDGEDHAFFKQFNKIDSLNQVVVAFDDDLAVGCGAIKRFNEDTVEVKRMFVLPEMRGRGIAAQILKELEIWAKELGFENTILETGIRQPEALRLYEKNNYRVIPNYGQYIGVTTSVCFIKKL